MGEIVTNNDGIDFKAEGSGFRILMSASRAPTTLSAEYAVGLERLKCSLIKHYGSEERPSPLKGVTRKFARRLAPNLLWRQTNSDLINLATSYAPDVIWLFKGMDIFPATVRALRTRGWHPVAYNADHPFDFSSRGSGNSNVAQAIPEYDLYMTFSRHIADQLAERHPSLNVCVLPFGHAVSDETYADLNDVKEAQCLCFVGTPDQRRVAMIRVLLDAGLDVDIYGSGWEKVASRISRARFHGPVFGNDMYRALRRYRVQLNFLRPHNIKSHNMRSFEAPACGAIMLAEDTVEHREFFRPGVEAFYFADDEELVSQARQLLDLSTEDAGAIRARARARSVEEPYSYQDRAAQALAHLKVLVGQ